MARLNGELTGEQKNGLDRNQDEDRREALRQRAKAAGLPDDARFGALLGDAGGMPLSAADEALTRGSARGTQVEDSGPRIRKRERSPEEIETLTRMNRFFGIEEPVKPYEWIEEGEEGLTNYQTSEETERIMRKHHR